MSGGDKKTEAFKQRTKAFARRVIRLVEALPKTRTGGILGARRGIAIIMVMVVLAGLTALAVPFIFSMLLQGRAARSDLHAAQARAGAQAALAHAIAHLQNNLKAPGFDPTPDVDTPDEYQVRMNIPLAGKNLENPRGLLWSAKISDEQGKVNLLTAPPTLIGNLLGSTTLSESAVKGANVLLVDDADVFYCDDDPNTVDGFIRIGGDTVPYNHVAGTEISLAPQGDYSLRRGHRQGVLVYDGRAIWIADYKFVPGRSTYRPFRSLYEIKAISDGRPLLAIRPDEFAALEPFVTLHSGRGGPAWGHAERIGEQSFQGDRETFTVENDNGFGPGTIVRFVQRGRALTFGRLDYVRVGRRSGKTFLHLEKPVGVGASGSGVGNDIFVAPELRHPININTAPAEVIRACVMGVGLAASTQSVSSQQAWNLADFLKKFVYRDAEDIRKTLQEAQRRGLISGQLSDAVYINATEFNSPKLRTSTVPFCFRNFGSFRIEASGIVSAPNGVQLARRTLRQVVTLPSLPPGKFHLATQQDWQQLVDQGMSARVLTWPRAMGPNTSRYRYRRLNTVALADPNRGDVRLDVGQVGEHKYRGEWIEHCDNPRDPGYFQEGYDMSRRGPFKRAGISVRGGRRGGRRGAMPSGAVELWYKPFGGGQAFFFDQGEAEDRNRVSVFYQPGQGIVVRIFDANLEGLPVEYTYPATLDASRWHHVAASWRSSQMNGQEVRVDGQLLPRNQDALFKPGTRLAGDLDLDEIDSLELDDAADFPDAGAVQIGEEIIEYRQKNGSTLTQLRRGARMSSQIPHLEGEFVMPYGYSVGLGQDLRVGGATLSERLEEWNKLRTRVFVPKPPPDNVVKEDDTSKLPVQDATAFPKSGFLNVAGEVLYYKNRSATAFTGLERGLEGSTARDIRSGATVRLASVRISDSAQYDESGYIQLDNEDDGDPYLDTHVEWIAYNGRRTKEKKHYLLSHFSRTTRTVRTGTPPANKRVTSLSISSFRGQFGTRSDQAHSKKAKVIPVIRMAGPHCGDARSPVGDGISTVSIVERGRSDGDVRWVKRAFVRQYANTRDRRDKSGRVVARVFVDWGFEYWAGLNDFVSRRYPRRNTRFLKFPSGELPDNGVPQRTVGASMTGEGLLSGYVDEVKVNALSSLGGRVAMDINATGLPAGANAVDIELNTTWAAPAGRQARRGFNPQWPRSGLIKIEDELIFYANSSTSNVSYYADKAPKLEDKANRRWRNEVHPNIERKQVMRLSGLKRGVLGTDAVDHPPGAGALVYDGAPITMLKGNLAVSGDSVSLLDARGFPAEGNVWIGEEVISYTQRRGNTLSGARVFRGRYGTQRRAHRDGEIAQALPFRYWDRHAFEYDGDGLAYLQAGHSATGAIWDTVEIKTRGPSGEPLPNFCRPRLLVRFDGRPAWDSQPTNREGGLYEFRGQGVHPLKGRASGGGVKGDQIELRVYWQYSQGAFQPSQDWKSTFALDELRATYHSPLVLRRLEEIERR